MSTRVLGRGPGEAQARSDPAQPAKAAQQARAVPATRQLHRAGYASLLLLALALPFELTQRPLWQSRFLTLTDLKLAEYLAVGLALATLAGPGWAAAAHLGRRPGAWWGYLLGQGRPVGLFVALVACCLLSSLLAHDKPAGLKWTLDLALGGSLWLAMPVWLAGAGASGMRRLTLALLVGATIAALVGLLEIGLGVRFDQSLTFFKPKPTLAGPYLRLSATFEYANIAAMFFELALPFALSGLVSGLARPTLSAPRLICWSAACYVLLEALLLTYSRGALLGLVLGLVALLLVALRAGGSLRLPAGRLGLLAVAVGLGLLLGGLTFGRGSLAALRLDTQSDQEWYAATYSSALPGEMAVCQRLSVPVSITNQSPLTWNAAGSQRYLLGYHWLYPTRRVAIFEGRRTALPADLPPGGSLRLVAGVQAPAQPGRYLLVWDMVDEHVSWFSLKSARYGTLPVLVQGRRAAAGLSCPLRPGHAAPPQPIGPTTLPVVLAQPDRQQLWRAALSMVAHRPLLGVGPDGFRLNYGRYSRPPQTRWDQRILANSLYLELFADLGLLGGMLYLGLLGAICWPLLLTIRRGGQLSPTGLALCGALVAFLVHGLVDYNLQSHAIFLLFWILCGMAASEAGAAARPGRVSGVANAGRY